MLPALLVITDRLSYVVGGHGSLAFESSRLLFVMPCVFAKRHDVRSDHLVNRCESSGRRSPLVTIARPIAFAIVAVNRLVLGTATVDVVDMVIADVLMRIA